MLESNNKSIDLNILFVPCNTKQTVRAYPPKKHNNKRKNQVILLMIIEGKKWHYLAVKRLPSLLRGVISSNHNGDFYCLNCLHSYRTENKLKKDEKVCNDYDYCYVEMLDEFNKILKYNHGEKSLKVPTIIYADLECLLEKMHSCQNNREKSFTEKKTKHTPSGYSLFTNCSFDSKKTKNKLDCYEGKGCMEGFCQDLREHAMKIVNYEKKQMIPLTR